MACTIDFRRLDEGLGGPNNKRKRTDSAPAAMDIDSFNSADPLPPPKRAAVPSLTNPDAPAHAFSTATYDGVIAGRVSGRKWKQPRTHRASALKVSLRGSSFEQRAKDKEVKRAFRERKEGLKEEIRARKVEKRVKKEEREKRKQENILRSGSKLQKVTNPKTLKKIAKSKQRKQLKVVSEEVFSGKKGKK